MPFSGFKCSCWPYAYLNWATHAQRPWKRNLENLLIALLKQFIGSIDQSSSAYKNGHEIVEKDFNRLGSRRFRGHGFKFLGRFGRS